MPVCEVCGNDYPRAFRVEMDGKTYTFDSFECAIHKLAPKCEHCGCQIIGHGAESRGKYYCCAHCAQSEGVTGIVDNAVHAGRT